MRSGRSSPAIWSRSHDCSAAAFTAACREAGRAFGRGLPYLSIGDYPGKIIAIEGTDGVGRSTQIRLLREWLEVQGYGVLETGWTRSTLMQPTIDLAKASNTLNKLTFVLLYATDFADRLEKEIIPALRAGFIVLADRYVFTAIARARARGVDRAWLQSLYGFAIAPHLVFYLKIDVDTLARRILESRGMDFWESGMDMKLGDDIYDSFRTYQAKLLVNTACWRRNSRFGSLTRGTRRSHPGTAAARHRHVSQSGRAAASRRRRRRSGEN